MKPIADRELRICPGGSEVEGLGQGEELACKSLSLELISP
jgi:hypothetical protein